MSMEVQQTISTPTTLSGRGLFGGHPVKITFKPAPPNHGIVFVRSDQNTTRIPALIRNVVKRDRRTTLKVDGISIDTCEHCMSALAGLGIDNAIIEVEGPELPGFDGSARPFLDALLESGITASETPRQRLIIKEPVVIHERESMIAAVPSNDPGMQVVYDLDYPDTAIGRQVRAVDFPTADYADQIAPARTFVLEREANAMRSIGVGAHLTPEDVLVIGDDGPLGGNALRFDDEPVRHKIVDLLGDLYLLGAPIQGRIIAYKSGHALNHSLVRQLQKQLRVQNQQHMMLNQNTIDIRRLSRIMPHRYPMLLIDRVVELEENKRAVGIKNVTINEPYFQGHYPNTPIMPGVLIVEAMAQLSGVLIGQTLQHTGRIPVLLSLDRVKLRRPVTPGDQLVLHAEALRVRMRIAHMRCRAFVGSDLAAEAEVKFMLVDDEPD